ncbi:MAG: hypothetical protein AAGD25_18110 [Cyanobacteria bacterium P01_F01_bin.150]
MRDNASFTIKPLPFEEVRYASLHSTLHLLLFLSSYRIGAIAFDVRSP